MVSYASFAVMANTITAPATVGDSESTSCHGRLLAIEAAAPIQWHSVSAIAE